MVEATVGRVKADLAAFGRERGGGPHSHVILLGLRNLETAALLKKVEAGLPYSAFERLRGTMDLSIESLARLIQLPARTLARRREAGRLTPDESDRLVRVSRVFGMTLALFEGDVEAARAWFATPAPALGDRTPLDVSTTEIGAREVENLIGRLEHGVFT